MEEEKKEEETTETDTTLASEETSEETEEAETETVETGEAETEKDIDFKKELEVLETKKPTRSEREKAEYSFKSTARRLKELGADPAEVLGITKKEAEESEYVTKEELQGLSSNIARQQAETQARNLAKTEDELKVVMWQYDHGIQKTGNISEDIENAHLLANKGRLKRVASEIERAKVKPGQGGGPGQRPAEQPSKVNPQEMAEWVRAGFKYNPTTKTYQAKYNEKYYDPKEKKWLQRKLAR